MKKIIPLLFCTFTIYSHAQEIDCKEFIQTEIIDKIKDYKPTDLVPYSTDGKKWGLRDVKSKKNITEPLINFPNTFNPNLNIYIPSSCDIEISKNYTFYNLEKVSQSGYAGIGISETVDTPITIMEKKGFEVNEKGELIAYSKDYERHWGISKPIKYQDQYYLVIKLTSGSFLINQKGESIEEFRSRNIAVMPYEYEGEIVLYVEDKNFNKGFTTLSGKKILYNELLNNPLSGYKQDYFHYSIQQKRDYESGDIEESGVLDLTTLKWVVKPQKNYQIYFTIYTSSEEIENVYNSKNREKANIYFLATENGTEHFVLDINGKPIKPKL